MTEPRDQVPFADRTPPGVLQQRVAATLHRDGLVEPRSVRIRRMSMRAAFGLSVVALSFVAGRLQRQTTAVDARPEFLLLLYEDSTYRDDRHTAEKVAEYSAWADSLGKERALVLGEKLGLKQVQLPERDGRADTNAPTGLFIVRAVDLPSAREIAGSSPHLRHGGRIVVHEIDR